MNGKIAGLLKGQIPTSVFFTGFGLCLVLVPAGTLNLLLKVVFGLLLIGAGLYQIGIYVMEKESATLLDLFSGVIVLVIGGFLFTNPQIVIKLLPMMLGAFILVDSIWTLRGFLKLKKRGVESWKLFLAESLIFLVLGGFLACYPFQSVNNMILSAGWIFLANGVLDVVCYILLRKGMKKEPPVSGSSEAAEKQPEEAGSQTEKPDLAASVQNAQKESREEAGEALPGGQHTETEAIPPEKEEKLPEPEIPREEEPEPREEHSGEEQPEEAREAEPEPLEEWKD